MAQPQAEHLVLKGVLKGHGGWVTSLTTSADNTLISGSRDKSLIVWHLNADKECGYPQKRLTGHSHYIQDVATSSDGQFALSGSWDGTLRLWDLAAGKTTRRFIGHGKDVLSVAFSSDNRQIVSGSRDKKINLWNTLGQCKYSITEEGHQDWVSCVRFSPNVQAPVIVSAGWDNVVKVWNLANCSLRANLVGHSGYLNTVAVSPDGSLCASGGKDGTAMLWDLVEGRHLSSLDAGGMIHSLCFSPSKYWLCAATGGAIKIWDLESKSLVAQLNAQFPPRGGKKKAVPHQCLSLAWSQDGTQLFAGYTDNLIRVWAVQSAASPPISAASASTAQQAPEPAQTA